MRRVLLVLALASGAAVPAAAQPAETIEYYGQDVIGSIRVVFTPTGTVLARQDYEPFGRRLQTAPAMPKEGFGTQETDAESDQAYFHARMFQSRTARFGAVDPIFGGLFEPQGWNRYAYAGNNPVRFTDWTGEQSKDTGEGKEGPTCADIVKINPKDFWCGSSPDMSLPLFMGVGSGVRVASGASRRGGERIGPVRREREAGPRVEPQTSGGTGLTLTLGVSATP